MFFPADQWMIANTLDLLGTDATDMDLKLKNG